MFTGAPNDGGILRLGSGIGGSSLDYLLCARSESGKTLEGPCPNKGDHRCSECRLVKYCSKDCQRDHWKIHKTQCRHPYGSKDWQPAWVRENRQPAFIGDSGEAYQRFGRHGQYLWGNVPATDYLNLVLNEGEDQIDRDFNLCFSASGDLRNMVKTVNGLPQNYRGKVTIVMNDFNPYVCARNIILVCMLCDKLPPDVEELAEAAVHYSYSAALTVHQAQYLSYWMSHIIQSVQPSPTTVFQFGGPIADSLSHVSFMFSEDVMEILQNLLNSKYNLEVALADMHTVTLAPSRVDYRDRRLGALRPAHRVSSLSHSETGMVLPFGQSLFRFTEPNRILFDEDGKWLLQDSSSPLSGYDLINAVAGGKKRHVPHEDLFGSLFFHIKDQFAEFARRARRFKIEIIFHCIDMRDLAHLLVSARSPASDLPFHMRLLRGSSTSSLLIPPLLFDRIDTSNVMDTPGIEAVLRSWAPLLNRDNKHAALFVYSMNWILKQPGGKPTPEHNFALYSLAVKKLMEYEQKEQSEWKQHRLSIDPSLNTAIRLMDVAAFHDNGPSFNRYLKREKVPEVCDSLKIKRRPINQIHTKRLGIPLSNPEQKIHNLKHEEFYTLTSIQGANTSERFLEFGVDGLIEPAPVGAQLFSKLQDNNTPEKSERFLELKIDDAPLIGDQTLPSVQRTNASEGLLKPDIDSILEIESIGLQDLTNIQDLNTSERHEAISRPEPEPARSQVLTSIKGADTADTSDMFRKLEIDNQLEPAHLESQFHGAGVVILCICGVGAMLFAWWL